MTHALDIVSDYNSLVYNTLVKTENSMEFFIAMSTSLCLYFRSKSFNIRFCAMINDISAV